MADAAPATRPRVSVVMTCFDDAPTIAEALARLERLEGDGLQVVVVDDGSGDGTAELVRDWASGHPEATAVCLAANGGVALARRAGVTHARGDYVWFTDSDDSWQPDIVDRMATLTAGADADVVVCGATYFDTTTGSRRPLAVPSGPDRISGAAAFAMVCRGAIKGHLWNKLIRRSLLEGIEFPAIPVHSDLAMTLQVLGRAELVRLLDAALYTYHVRPGSLIGRTRDRTEPLDVVQQVFTDVVAARPELCSEPEKAYFVARFVEVSRLLQLVRETRRGLRRADVAAVGVTWRTAVGVARLGDLARSGAVAAALVHPFLLRAALDGAAFVRRRT